MNLVFVGLEKNIKNVVEPYRKIIKATITIINKIIIDNGIFLDSNILLKLSCGVFKELNSFKLVINPLLLPIRRNLFFLSLNISSADISLKLFKFFEIESFTFSK